MKVLAALVLLGGHAASAASDPRVTELTAHFKDLVARKAHEQDATHLPAISAGPVLGIDPAIFLAGDKGVDAAFEAIMMKEVALRAAAAPGERSPYVLCGPQSTAVAARKKLEQFSDGHTVRKLPRDGRGRGNEGRRAYALS